MLNGDLNRDGVLTVRRETLEQCISKKSLLYDKKGEEHYNLISALHQIHEKFRSGRGGVLAGQDAGGGEDPLYVARRVIRFASEDVGLADPQALQTAVAAYQAAIFLGCRECTVPPDPAVVYMSLAPKSNSLYVAYEEAKKDAVRQLAEPVPLVIRNAPTKLMKELEYGKGYQYAHDTEEKLTNMQCLPDSLLGGSITGPPGRKGKRVERAAGTDPGWKKRHG